MQKTNRVDQDDTNDECNGKTESKVCSPAANQIKPSPHMPLDLLEIQLDIFTRSSELSGLQPPLGVPWFTTANPS